MLQKCCNFTMQIIIIMVLIFIIISSSNSSSSTSSSSSSSSNTSSSSSSIVYVDVSSKWKDLAEKRLRFSQGLSLVLFFCFRIFYFCIVELWVLENLKYRKKNTSNDHKVCHAENMLCWGHSDKYISHRRFLYTLIFSIFHTNLGRSTLKIEVITIMSSNTIQNIILTPGFLPQYCLFIFIQLHRSF